MLAKLGQLQRLFMAQAAVADAWAMSNKEAERVTEAKPAVTAGAPAALWDLGRVLVVCCALSLLSLPFPVLIIRSCEVSRRMPQIFLHLISAQETLPRPRRMSLRCLHRRQL